MSVTDENIVPLPERDEPPKNDYWAPEVLEIEATEEELAEGNRLGDETRERAE